MKNETFIFEQFSGNGEKVLWFLVIIQAIKDYEHDPMSSNDVRTQQNIKRLADSAQHWLFYSKLETIGSLIWICDELDLPINKIRRKIKEGIKNYE